jgi:hypothetical protein
MAHFPFTGGSATGSLSHRRLGQGRCPRPKTGSFFGSNSGTPSGDLSERDYIMIDPDEANRAYTSAHAIAGFQLADIAFGVLVSTVTMTSILSRTNSAAISA